MTTKATILRAIRAKCLDCSVYQPSEVARCPITQCELWPFRFGKDPEPSKGRGFARAGYTIDLAVNDSGGTSPTGSPAPSSEPPVYTRVSGGDAATPWLGES